MENDLQSIYENSYLKQMGKSQVISEKKEESVEDEEDTKTPAVKKSVKKKKKIAAGELYNDSASFDSHFAKVLREFADDGEFGADMDDGDGDFDFEDEDGGEVVGGDAESVLRDVYETLKAFFGEGDDQYGDEDMGDEVPMESVNLGMQKSRDGTAKVQSKSTFVKDNGDAKFDDQDTGFDPEDTEGSEGAEHGAKTARDGTAKVQPKSNLIGVDGKANVGKTQRTGYKAGYVHDKK